MSWKFDKEVARTFPSHARSHIPNYEEVIGLSVGLCEDYGENAAIVDVGVATGETISQLRAAGFKNLYGIDSSKDMLDACPQGIATLIHSEKFPTDREFDVVLMNWTLHFIKDKTSYLRDIYQGLKPGGLFVLSEKVSTAPLPRRHYYDFKRSNGLSEEAIAEKEKSLEGVMHINDIPWYFENLTKVGFEETYVANAYWCFATFISLKPRA